MRILMINSNDTEREIYRIYIENTLTEAILRESPNVAAAEIELDNNPAYDAVLWFDKPSDMIAQFFHRLVTKSPATIFIVYGERSVASIPGLENFKSSNACNSFIPSSCSPKEFCLQLLRILSPSRSSLERVPAFQKVRLVNFYRFNHVLCPIYIQLSERKYVKVFNTHTTYLKADIDSYRNKGIEYFYIANSDFEKFKVTFTEQQFLERVEDGKESLDSIAATQILLKDLIKNIGISDSAIELANKNIESVKNFIAENPGLSGLFMRQNRRENYSYDHGHLVALVCCNIFHRLHWDTTDNIYKLCAAAVFHDLCLELDGFDAIAGNRDPKLSEFSADEVKHYLEHPEKMAKQLEKVNSISSDVIEIVRYHHEDGEGQGFYRLPPSRLSTIAATFIVAHRYIHLMYQWEFNPKKNQLIIEQLRKEFSHPVFSNILMAFSLPALNQGQQKVA